MYKEANIYAEVEFFPFVGVFFPYASNLLIPLAAHASFIIPSLVISYQYSLVPRSMYSTWEGNYENCPCKLGKGTHKLPVRDLASSLRAYLPELHS